MDAVRLAAPDGPPKTSLQEQVATGYLNVHKFDLFDMDKDGALNLEEYNQYMASLFFIYNEKRDGHLTFMEFSEFYTGPKSQPYTIRFHLASARQIEHFFEQLDTGHKGYLTVGDFVPMSLEDFKLNDVRHTGNVTPADMEEATRQNNARFKPKNR